MQETIEKWKKSLEVKKKSKKTIKSYVADIEIFLDWLQKEKQINVVDFEVLDSLRLDDFENYMYQLMKKDNKASTIARRINGLRNFYKYLNNHELVKNQYIKLVELPKISKRERSYLTEEELQLLIDNIKKDCHYTRNKTIVMIFASSGIRAEELENMNVEDIKTKQINNKDYYFASVIGKGDKERIVPISKETWEQYCEWIAIRPDIPPDNKGNPLFVSERGCRMTYSAIYDMIKNTLKRIGREDCSTHSIRHSFASNCLDKGGNIKAVQETLGHTRMETTAIYSHVNENQVIQMGELIALKR